MMRPPSGDSVSGGTVAAKTTAASAASRASGQRDRNPVMSAGMSASATSRAA